MAQFFVTSPDGQRFKVTAPDDASQDDVLAYARENFGGAKPVVKPSAPGLADIAATTSDAYQPPDITEPGLGGVQSGEEARIRTNVQGRIQQATDRAMDILQRGMAARVGPPAPPAEGEAPTRTPEEARQTLQNRVQANLAGGMAPEAAAGQAALSESWGAPIEQPGGVSASPLELAPGTTRFAGRTFLGLSRTAPQEVFDQYLGGLADYRRGVGRLIQSLSPADSSANRFGQDIESSAAADAVGTAPQPEEHNAITNFVASGARMGGQLTAATLASLLGGVPGLVGNAAAFAPIAADMGWDTYQRALAAGKDDTTARMLALTNGVTQQALGMGGYQVGSVIAKGALAKLLGGRAPEDVVARFIDPSKLGAAATAYAGATADAFGTMTAMTGAQAAIEHSAGISDKTAWQAMKEAAPDNLAFAVAMGPLAAIGGVREAGARAQVGKLLSDPTTPTADRMAAVREIGRAIYQVNPQAATDWMGRAGMQVQMGKPVVWTEGKTAPPRADFDGTAAIDPALAPKLAPGAPNLPTIAPELKGLDAAGVAPKDFLEAHGDILGRPFSPEVTQALADAAEIARDPQAAARLHQEMENVSNAAGEGAPAVAPADVAAQRGAEAAPGGERAPEESVVAPEPANRNQQRAQVAEPGEPAADLGRAAGVAASAKIGEGHAVGERATSEVGAQPGRQGGAGRGEGEGVRRGNAEGVAPAVRGEEQKPGGEAQGKAGTVERRVADRAALKDVSPEAIGLIDKYGASIAPLDAFAYGDQQAFQRAGMIKDVNGRKVVDIGPLIRERARREGEQYGEVQEAVNAGGRGRVAGEPGGRGGGEPRGGGERGRNGGQREAGNEPALAAQARGEEEGGARERGEEEGVLAPHQEREQVEIAGKEHEIAPNPTEPQKEAGNYQKGHQYWNGLNVSWEHAKGGERNGVDPNTGKPWSSKIAYEGYGYIRGTIGKDKDHIDIGMGPHPESDHVVVVDQKNPRTGLFDEHKVLAGYLDTKSAIEGYKANYPKDWRGLGKVTETNVEGLKNWLENGDHKKPASAPTQLTLFQRAAPGMKERLREQVWKPAEREKGRDVVTGMTFPKLYATAQKLLKYYSVGEHAKEWYKDTVDELLKRFNGDKLATDTFMQIIAITSASTEVKANFTAAEKALVQFSRGEPIHVGVTNTDRKLNDLLYFGIRWEGVKTNTFYRNFMEHLYGKEAAEKLYTHGVRTTQDMHMGELMLGKKQLSDAEYKRLDALTQFIARETGSDPMQAQAAIWVAQKAQSIYEDWIAQGKHTDWSEARKRREAMAEASVNYGEVARRKLGMFAPAEGVDVGALARGVAQRRAENLTLPAETRPSTSTTLGARLDKASAATLREYHDGAIEHVFGRGGIDGFLRDMGFDATTARYSNETGTFEGKIAPNTLLTVRGIDRAGAERLARAWMYVFHQDAVPFSRADERLSRQRDFATNPERAVGYKLFLKEPLNGTQERTLYDALRATIPGAEFTRLDEQSYWVANFRNGNGEPFSGLNDREFTSRMMALAVGRDDVISHGISFHETGYPTHDWKADPTGQALRDAVRERAAGTGRAAPAAGRSDLPERLDVLAARARDWESAFGAGTHGDLLARGRADERAAVSGGAAEAGQAKEVEPTLFQPKGGGEPLSFGSVSHRQALAVASRFRSVLPNKSIVVIHRDAADAGAYAIKNYGGDRGHSGALGWFDQDTGEIHVVVGNHSSPEQVFNTLVHETAGHYGFRALLGPEGIAKVWRTIDAAIATKNPYALKLRDSVYETHPEIKDVLEANAKFKRDGDALYDANEEAQYKALRADEMVARATEAAFDADGRFRPGFEWLKRVYSVIAEHLRGLGLNVKLTQAEMDGLISRAAEYMRGHDLDWSDEHRQMAERMAFQQPAREPIWKSALKEAIDASKQASATGRQWLATIEGLPGVKKDEIEWSGVRDYLAMRDQDKVAKADVQQFIDRSLPGVGEIIKGDTQLPRGLTIEGSRGQYEMRDSTYGLHVVGDGIPDAAMNMVTALEREANRWRENGNGGRAERMFGRAELINQWLEQFEGHGPGGVTREGARFGQWVLPGGKDYREHLLTLDRPETEMPTRAELATVNNIRDVSDEQLREAWQDGRLNVPANWKNRPGLRQFTEGHWHEPDVLAHFRTTTRTDAEGKKVLFVEEFQSDWAQKGRSKGFEEPPKPPPPPIPEKEPLKTLGDVMREGFDVRPVRDPFVIRRYGRVFEVFAPHEPGQERIQVEGERWGGQPRNYFSNEQDIVDAVNRYQNREEPEPEPGPTKVPRAPFVGKTESWTALAMKRVIRWAVDHRYDRVAWTSGAQQAQRYESALRQAVDRIEWIKTPEGVHIRGYEGTFKKVDTIEKESALSDAIGKTMADQIIASPEQSGRIEDDNIKISDTGMAAYYDRMVPNITNDLLKKMGGEKVKVFDLGGTEPPSEYRVAEGRYPNGNKYYYPRLWDAKHDTWRESDFGQADYHKFVVKDAAQALADHWNTRMDTANQDLTYTAWQKDNGKYVVRSYDDDEPGRYYTDADGDIPRFSRYEDNGHEFDSRIAAEEMAAKLQRYLTTKSRKEPGEMEVGKQLGFDITPQMKLKAAAAMPMFQRRAPYSGLRVEERKPPRGPLGEAVRVLAPASPFRGPYAELQAGIMRSNLGEMKLMHERAVEQLKDLSHFFSKFSARDNYDFIDRMERGQAQPTPELEAAAKALRLMLDERRDMVRALGSGALQNFIENYFPHIWTNHSAAQEFWSSRPLAGRATFLKERVYDYFKEGIDAGLKPLSDNPVDLALLKIKEMDRYLYGQRIFREMKDRDLARFVKFGHEAPEGWVKLDDKIARVLQYSETEGGFIHRGDYFAPEPAATIFNNYLQPGLRGNALYDAVHTWGGVLNSAQLGFSAFHLGFTTIDAATSKLALGIMQTSRGIGGLDVKDIGRGALNIAQAFNPAQPFVNVIKGDRLLKAALSGSTDPRIAEVVRALVNAGGIIRYDSFYKNAGEKTFMRAWRQHQYFRALARAAPSLMETTMRPIFEYLVPRQKLGVFLDLARDALERNPNMSIEEARRTFGKLWDSVDNRLGQVVYDNLFWNKTLKDSLMIGVRSVGWNMGTIRELGGGALDLARPGAYKEWGGLSPRAAYVFALPIMAGVLGSVIHYLFNGEGPQDIRDMYFPRTGRQNPDGSDERWMLPTYMKDIYEYKHAPFQTLLNKLHPLTHAVAQMIENQDFFGRAIVVPSEPMEQKALDWAGYMLTQIEPFGARNLNRARQVRGEPPAEGITDFGKWLAEYVTSPQFIGITPAPAYMTRSDEDNTAIEMSRNRSAVVAKFAAMVREGADKTELRQRMQDAGMAPRDITFVLNADRPRYHVPRQLGQ